MANVVRFALSTAKTLYVPGAGTFIAGILDVDANNLALLTKTRYLVQPYRAVELGTVDAATPKPTLPAVPGPPAPDPYPQYLTAAEAASSPELRAAYGPSIAARSTVLRTFHAALAAAYFQPCNVATLGDSRMEGAMQTVLGRRYVDRMAANLRTRYGLTPGAVTNFLPPDYAGGTVHAGTPTGGFGLNIAYGLGKRAWQTTTAGTITQTFTGTSFKVKGVGNSGTGSFSVAIDGGAATTVDTSTFSSTTADGLTFYTSGALTAGSHTVVLSWVSGFLFIDGIEVYNGDESKGLRLYDGGHSGFTSGQWANITGSDFWPQAYAAVDPHLLLIELGANDQSNDVLPTTYQANLQTIIAAVRTACGKPNLPVVLVAGGARTDGSWAHPWSEYVAAMAAVVAADSHTLLFDGTQRFPTGADTSFFADGLHESDIGHAAKAAALSEFLLPA